MSDITYSRLPQQYRVNEGSWQALTTSGVTFWPGGTADFKLTLPGQYAVKSCNFTINLEFKESDVWVCQLYRDAAATVLLQEKTYTPSGSGPHTFSYTGINADTDTLVFRIRLSQYALLNYRTVKVQSEATAVFSAPALTVNVQPSVLYAGDSLTLDFVNRLKQALTVSFYYNSTKIDERPANSDRLVLTALADWFDRAGVSGSSMSVKVRASDSLGRTSSDATFTLKRAVGGSVSPVAPRSTTVDGAGAINFAWTYSGDGTLTKTELQWSQDNAAWTDLATINGSGTAWTAPAVKFPGGTIYWRARATNSFNIVGDWCNSVSFSVAYSATSQVVPTDAPTSGIINAQLARSFAVALRASGPVYDPFTITAATFYWRSGTSGTWTEVAMTASGSGASVTIPAGTFPSGPIQWKASATDNTGRTTETAEYTLTTLNADIDAAPLSPINTVESGSSPIVFRWSYGSIDGSSQSKAELQFSTNGTSWGEPVVVSGSETSYTAPSDTFNGGTVYWRVRAYNRSNTAGPWSAAVSFVVFAAPIVRGVTGTDKPFSTISWQVEGQLAYKIEVDGRLYGPYFGADVRSFDLPEPLSDGLHTVRVAAQNQYGLWSEWAEGTVNISNQPGGAVSISGVSINGSPVIVISGPLAPYISSQPRDVQSASADVIMETGVVSRGTEVNYQWQRLAGSMWISTSESGNRTNRLTITPSESISGRKYRLRIQTPVGIMFSREATFTFADPAMATSPFDNGVFFPDTGYFLVYRDGKLIGKTYALRSKFIDRAALGTHQYFVVQVLPRGFYTKSNTVTVTAAVDSPMIAPLAGGDFLELTLSKSANRSQSIKRAQEVAYTQYAGATFPTAEIGEHESLSASGDVSYPYDQAAEAAAFEALMGKPVIYKTPGGACVVGVLEGFQRDDPLFFKSYSFSVTQMERRDYVDATDSL